MRVGVFGLGYVGSISAACLARDGHTVTGVDVNPAKVDMIRSGRAPVIEPGLEPLISEGIASGRLQASTDTRSAVRGSDVSVICVGTPSRSNGSLNLDYVDHVCREIGGALADSSQYHVVAVRSTVLPSTVRERLIPVIEEHSGRRAGDEFGICMNPEFLREGTGIADYDDPSQIVIGQFDERSGSVVQSLYDSIDAPVVRTELEIAEMVKYISNSFHALKVSFANEVGTLARAHGVDGRDVMEIFCRDRQLNISPAYLRPGFAFGGSCLPKDLRAIRYRAKERDLELPLFESVLPSNVAHLNRAIAMVEEAGQKRVGILGLSFKAGTDDLRESPVVPLVETLLGRGYEISIYDEHVRPERLMGANKSFIEHELPHIAQLMRPSIEAVLAESDVVVVANGAKPFRCVPTMLTDDQILIDLAGIVTSPGETRERYVGICW